MLRGDRTRSALPSLAFADVDPAGVVESCLTVARPLAERAGLELGVELGPRLPRIVADELSLRQMLLNLLANAIKFARRGDRVTVAVAYDADGPLTISVADTGPGMTDAPKADCDGAGPRPAADPSAGCSQRRGAYHRERPRPRHARHHLLRQGPGRARVRAVPVRHVGQTTARPAIAAEGCAR